MLKSSTVHLLVGPRHRNLVLTTSLLVFLIWLVLAAVYVSQFPKTQLRTEQFTILTLCIAVLSILLVYLRKGIGFHLAYIGYLSLAHLGTVSVFAMVPGVNYEDLFSRIPSWLESDYLPAAINVTGIGIIFFTLGALITPSSSAHLLKSNISLDNRKNSLPRNPFYVTGLTLILVYFLYLLASIISGKIVPFGSYSDYREATGQSHTFLTLLFEFGICFVFATGTKTQIKRTLPVIIACAVILLSVGTRGQLFYPTLMAIALLYIRGQKLSVTAIFLLAFVMFIIFPAVRQLRAGGITSFGLLDLGFSFFYPFLEAGVILRPLTVTYSWIASGEAFALGRTYWIPVHNILAYLPGIDRPPLDGTRYFLTQRTPTQGYSTLAEAYFNFGYIGVAGKQFLISIIISTFTNKRITPATFCFSAGLMLLLSRNIRGHFLSFPGHTIILSALILIPLILITVARIKR